MKLMRLAAAALALACLAPSAHAQIGVGADLGSDIAIAPTWADLTVAYPALASTAVYIQNRSPSSILVEFSTSATAPAGGGMLLFQSNSTITGNAAHIWVRSMGVSGTVSAGLAMASSGVVGGAVTQSGSWTVGISGTVPVSGTFFQATQPISAAALPLPAGAATSGNQSTQITAEQAILASLAGGISTSSYMQAQALAGKCFVFALPLTSVSVGNYLNVTLSNPSGSGQTFIIFDRRFSQTTGSVLLYTTYTSPTALSGATTKSGSNELNGSSNSSAVSMAYLVSSTAMTGTLVGSMPIPPNGVENTPITSIRTLPPGSSIGYQFGGTGGVLTAASQFTISIEGCTQ